MVRGRRVVGAGDRAGSVGLWGANSVGLWELVVRVVGPGDVGLLGLGVYGFGAYGVELWDLV